MKKHKQIAMTKVIVQIGWSPYAEKIKTYQKHMAEVDRYLEHDGCQTAYEAMTSRHIREVNETIDNIDRMIAMQRRHDNLFVFADTETAGQSFQHVIDDTDLDATMWVHQYDPNQRFTGQSLISVTANVDGKRFTYAGGERLFAEIMEYFDDYKF